MWNRQRPGTDKAPTAGGPSKITLPTWLHKILGASGNSGFGRHADAANEPETTGPASSPSMTNPSPKNATRNTTVAGGVVGWWSGVDVAVGKGLI